MTDLSLVPPTLRIGFVRGDLVAFEVRWLDAAGAPVALTGTYTAEVRADADSTVLATFAVTDSGTSVAMQLTPVDTATLPSFCRFDLQRTVAPDQVHTMILGELRRTRDVTHA